MRIIRSKSELREALDEPRREGLRIGLVPTMGYFHEGHLSLMRAARRDCDVVVVSLFVNIFAVFQDLRALSTFKKLGEPQGVPQTAAQPSGQQQTAPFPAPPASPATGPAPGE